jgi:hypothetical protein
MRSNITVPEKLVMNGDVKPEDKKLLVEMMGRFNEILWQGLKQGVS